MRPDKPIDLVLPITPMLDTSFQLLSFFVLTFREVPSEGQLAIHFPPSILGDEIVRPTGDDPDVQDHYTIRVRATANGDIAGLSLAGPTMNLEKVDAKDLLKELKAIPRPAGEDAKGVSLAIESAAGLQYTRLIEIMDICRKAGLKEIALSPLSNKK